MCYKHFIIACTAPAFCLWPLRFSPREKCFVHTGQVESLELSWGQENSSNSTRLQPQKHPPRHQRSAILVSPEAAFQKRFCSSAVLSPTGPANTSLHRSFFSSVLTGSEGEKNTYFLSPRQECSVVNWTQQSLLRILIRKLNVNITPRGKA